MMTGLVVLKIVLMPSRQRRPSLANSGPRWSMMGVSIARRMRSGNGVGPGIWRKWRPTGREEFLDICLPWRVWRGLKYDGRVAVWTPACRHQLRMRQSVKTFAALPVGRVARRRFFGIPARRSPMSETVVPGLERRLRAELTGDVMFDRFS